MSATYEFQEGSQIVFRFLEMFPSPQGPQSHQTYLTRTNVDGVSIYNDGLRGSLFTLQTTADSEDEQSGENLIKDYEAKTGSIIEIIYQDRNYGRYLIDAVRTHGFWILKLIGGKNHTDPKFVISAEWSLFPVNPT